MKKIINYEISDLVIRKNSKSSYGLEETPLNNVFKLSCPVSLKKNKMFDIDKRDDVK